MVLIRKAVLELLEQILLLARKTFWGFDLDGDIKIAAPAAAPQKEEFSLLSEIENSINDEIAERLKKTDLNTLTPIEAINLVWELKGKLGN